jgi:hypothetical protein
MKKINPFNVAYEQYQKLAEKTRATNDIQEKNIMLRRRINLLGVMEFLILETRQHN